MGKVEVEKKVKDKKSNSSSNGGSASNKLMETSLMQKKADTHSKLFNEETIQKKENTTGLPDNLKNGMENLSGMSLDHVKVHYNSSKPAQVGAHAYAQGSEIHLASGQEKHLPHELGHVVQQAEGRVKVTSSVGGMPVNDSASLESEADVMGAKALQMQSKTSQPLSQKSSNSSTIQKTAISSRKDLEKYFDKSKFSFIKENKDKSLAYNEIIKFNIEREKIKNETDDEKIRAFDFNHFETLGQNAINAVEVARNAKSRSPEKLAIYDYMIADINEDLSNYRDVHIESLISSDNLHQLVLENENGKSINLAGYQDRYSQTGLLSKISVYLERKYNELNNQLNGGLTLGVGLLKGAGTIAVGALEITGGVATYIAVAIAKGIVDIVKGSAIVLKSTTKFISNFVEDKSSTLFKTLYVLEKIFEGIENVASAVSTALGDWSELAKTLGNVGSLIMQGVTTKGYVDKTKKEQLNEAEQLEGELKDEGIDVKISRGIEKIIEVLYKFIHKLKSVGSSIVQGAKDLKNKTAEKANELLGRESADLGDADDMVEAT